jgi:hypothetical protein
MKYDASENLSAVSVLRHHLKTAAIVAVAADAIVAGTPEMETLDGNNMVAVNTLGGVFQRKFPKMPQRALWLTTSKGRRLWFMKVKTILPATRPSSI